MTRRFIKEFGDREAIREVFLVAEKQLRKNRNGNLYLQMRLSDRSGTVNALMWNANEGVAKVFDNGDFVQIEGTTQYYNGTLQVIVKQIDQAEPGEVNREDFYQLSASDIERFKGRLTETLRSITDYHLRNLAECFLIDEVFMDRFTRAPAAVKNHHAYHGGLLEHVLSLMDLVQSVVPHYPQLDRDLLLMGAFLHDIGKTGEMTYDPDLGYSDEGQLIGHVVMAVEILGKKIDETVRLSDEPFPEELSLRLKHMIVSHHGQYEFGSPKLPMTPEAIALHLLDNLDAKICNFDSLIADDVNTDSHWTTYHANLGRKLFKGSRKST